MHDASPLGLVRISAGLTLLVFLTSLAPTSALVTDSTFSNGGDYTYNGAVIEVTGGEARLIGTPFVDDADPGEFGAGTPSNTVWDGLASALKMQTLSTALGTFTSRVFDSNVPSKPWTGFSWLPLQAYGKSLPANQGVETGYATNVSMANNVLLLKGEETTGTSLADSSGQGNTATCTNCPTLGGTGKINKAPAYDGVNDSSSIADAASLDLTNAATIESWIKVGDATFDYRRPINLENATVLAGVQIKVEFDASTFTYANAQNEGQDIRFTDATGAVLPHWIEFWNKTDTNQGWNGKSRIWVKIPTAGTSAITMHYGNTEVETTSNGSDVFPLFENAEHSLDTTNIWDALDTSGSGYNPNKLVYLADSSYVTNGYIQQTAWVSKNNYSATTPLSFETSMRLQTVQPQLASASASAVPTYCQGFYNGVGTNASYAFCWHISEKITKTAMTRSKSYTAHHFLTPSGFAFSQPHYNQPVDDDDPWLPGQEIRLSTLINRDTETLTVSSEGDNSVSIVHSNLGSYNEYGRDGSNVLQFDPTTPVVYGRNGNSLVGNPTQYKVYWGGDHFAYMQYNWAFLRNVDTVSHVTSVGAEESVANAVPYAGSWMYEKTLTINGTVPENDFQIFVPNTVIPSEKLHDGTNDVRFYQASDGQELPYWKEGETGHRWVKLANKDETTLIVRYGNPGAKDVKYKGEDVFLLFDEFNGRHCLEADTVNPDCINTDDGLGTTKFNIPTVDSDGQTQVLWRVENPQTSESGAVTDNGFTAKLENGRLALRAKSANFGSWYNSFWEEIRFQSAQTYAPTNPAVTGLALNIKSSFNSGQLTYACWSFGNQFDSPAVSQSNRIGFWVPHGSFLSAMHVFNAATNPNAPAYSTFECPMVSSGVTTTQNANNGIGITAPVVGANDANTAYMEIMDFIMAKDGLRRKRITRAAGAVADADNIAPVTTYPSFVSFSGPGRISFYMNGGYSYDASMLIDRIILRKTASIQDAVQPSVTDNNDEKIIGAGKHGAYGFAFTGNKVYASFGGIDQGVSLDTGWNHIAATFNGSILRLYKKGAQVATQSSVFSIPNTTTPLQIGGPTTGTSTPARLAANIQLDDFALYSRVLTAGEVLTNYLRNGMQLLLQLRSCDDAACDTETFVGPDGTAGTYYDESGNTGLTPPTQVAPNIGSNRYAQYQVTLRGDGTYTPGLQWVRILPSAYSALAPMITQTLGTAYQTIAGFVHALGVGNEGSVEYQVSHNGADWYFWNGTTWVEETGANYPTQTSTATEVNAGIPFFPLQVGTGTLQFRAFLISNGGQYTTLDNVQLTYGTTNQAPGAPTAVFINTLTAGAQTGQVNPTNLTSNVVVVSALTSDPDVGDVIRGYRLEVATDALFATVVYDSTVTDFGTPFLAGGRMPDIAIPTNVVGADITYYVRVRAVDAAGNVSPVSATATFAVPDTTAPTLSSSNPAHNDTGVARTQQVSLVFADNLAGVNSASIDVDIDGTAAVVAGVCQTGFACTITPTGNGYTVALTPNVPFAFNDTIVVDWTVADSSVGANTASGSVSFQTALNGAPTAPTTLHANTATLGSTTGVLSPVSLNTDAVVVSAVHQDPDGDAASKYRVQVATDNGFATVVHDATVTLGAPLAHGARLADVTIPAGVLDANNTYFWRIKFWDTNDFEGAFSPAGVGAAQFTLVDDGAPTLLSATPVTGATAVARDSSVTLVLGDAFAGVDTTTLDVSFGATPVIVDGVCQTGFACTLTPSGTDVTVLINPDADFAGGTTVAVTWSLADLATVPNTATGSLQFTTVSVVATIPLYTGSGGGAAPAPAQSPDPGVRTPSGESTSPAAPQSPETALPRIPLPPVLTFEDPRGQQRQINVGGILEALLGGGATAGEGTRASAPASGALTTTLQTLSDLFFPVVAGQQSTVPTLPPRGDQPGAPETYAQSVCSQLTPVYSYIVPNELPEDLKADIALAHKIGVNFSKGQKVLDVQEPVTRSELLKYLLQISCADFAYDVTGIPTFPDVAESHPNFLYIQVGRKYKLVSGYVHDGLFRADQQITEAEALKIITEFFSDEDLLDGTAEVFPLDYRQWYGRYVRFATDKVILRAGQSFSPDRRISLADALRLLVDALPLRGRAR